MIPTSVVDVASWVGLEVGFDTDLRWPHGFQRFSSAVTLTSATIARYRDALTNQRRSSPNFKHHQSTQAWTGEPISPEKVYR